MLDIKSIRDNIQDVKDALAKRNMDHDLLEQIKEKDALWRGIQTRMEEIRARQKKMSREKPDPEKLEELKGISLTIKDLDAQCSILQQDIREIMMNIPNIPDESTPEGNSEEDNLEIRKWGKITDFDFQIKSHEQLGEEKNILSFEDGAKLSGARFTVYYGDAARLERALINFMLELHTEQHGYLEVLPPFLVSSQTMTGTGQLPKFAEDSYQCNDDLWLIPTAEVPVTNLRSQEIIEQGKLPLNYTAYTPCFRREAGSYGKDTKGLIRQHQFNKVELVKIVEPDSSEAELEKLTNDAEKVLRLLELPYRVVQLCSGDLGFSAAKTYDLEVWMPSQQKYREISSCSNFKDFQARRANIRFKNSEGKNEFVHTINGSGLAVGRTLAAIFENYQQKDGSILIPKALQSYMKKEKL